MTINILHFTCEFVGNKGEAFVGLMGRSISGEGERKALKRNKKKKSSQFYVSNSQVLKKNSSARTLTEVVR